MTRFQVRNKLRKAGSKAKAIAIQHLGISQVGVAQNRSRLGIRKMTLTIGTVTFLSIATAQAAQAAAAVRTGFNSNTLERNDDGSTDLVNIGFIANFLGVQRSELYVNNNGNVTFDNPLGQFTASDLNSTNVQIIAPFWADVDTTNSASQAVTYGTGTIDGRNAFGANWQEVGYFGSRANKLNSFQLVLVERSDTGAGNFDIEYNYDQIQWETGEASGGVNGLGGNSARVGYSNGTGAEGTSFEFTGSGVNGTLLDGGSKSLVANRFNSNVDGRYLFNARNGSIAVPEPFTIVGTLAAGGIGVVLRRKSKQQAKDTAQV
jgi:Nidogen-like